MSSNSPIPSEARQASGLRELHVESFVNHICAAGYADCTVRKRRRFVESFARWTRDKQVAVIALDESHMAAFLKRSPRGSKERVALEGVALRLFLRHLRAEGEVPLPRPQADSLETPPILQPNSARTHHRLIRALPPAKPGDRRPAPFAGSA